MVRFLKALMESSTKPASFSVSVWMATCTSISSATERQASMAAGVVPQSSWSLRPMAPAATCSRRGSGREELPLPRKPRLMGRPSAASSMRWMFHAPAEHVVALVPVAGPVPPPMSVVIPAERASSTSCGQMKWMCESMPPAVTMRPSPAMTSVEASRTRSPTVGPKRSAYWRLGSLRLMSSRSLESGLGGLPQRGLPARVVHLAVGEGVQAVDLSRAGQLHERHDLLVAGLEAHGGARGDVEPHAPGLASLEPERAVGLEEVEMRAHLDRPASFIRDDVALAQNVLARNHAADSNG